MNKRCLGKNNRKHCTKIGLFAYFEILFSQIIGSCAVILEDFLKNLIDANDI